MNWKPFSKGVAHWTIPPGVQELIRRGLSRIRVTRSPDQLEVVLERNRRLRNKHTGSRCFILATGPSIREQDLRPLAHEWCIAVSEFYRHPHYREINPAYYAFAPNHPPFTDEDFLRELAELKERSQREEFFFAIHDKPVVERSNLVADLDRLHFLHYQYGGYRPEQIDLTATLPGPCSAALVGTWVAVFLGFSEIYLVGCDHDLLWKWDGNTPFLVEKHYHHFYDGAPATGHESADVDGLLNNAMELRNIYRWTNQIALRQGTKICNANPRGRLDVVPRVSFANLFRKPAEA